MDIRKYVSDSMLRLRRPACCAALLLALLLASSPGGAGQTRTSVSQWGITWTFAQPAQVGRYVTGDWWVVGPVTVTKIDPAPVPGRNGSLVNPQAGPTQAYDDRAHNYNPAGRVEPPVTLTPGDALVTAASVEKVGVRTPDTVPHQYLRGPLRTAAVLSCEAKPPPAGTFRPAYVGTWRKRFTTKDLHLNYLPDLAPVEPMPDLAPLRRVLQRIWLDHQRQWVNRKMHPLENMPDYGREITTITGTAGLLMLVADPNSRRRDLLHKYVQLGIDWYGVTQSDPNLWYGNGGHNSGRKLPILLAGILLDSEEMQHVEAVFSEDEQTYYGKGYAGQKALFSIAVHNANARHEEVPPDQWETFGQGANNGRKAEGYRKLNGPTWVAAALAVRLLGAGKLWGHPAYLDYVDRWMREEGKAPAFVEAMWDAYRGRADEIGARARAKRR